MKFKVLPRPLEDEDLGGIPTVHAAVPLVPDGEGSCCARLVRRSILPARDHARAWLTFLRALELVDRTDGEYRRRRGIDPDAIRRSFRQRVYLAEPALDALAATEEPLDVDAVFERLADRVPRWERQRHADPDDEWREHVARLLEWLVVLDLAERSESGYVTA